MKMFKKSFWKIRKKRKSYAVTPKPTMISPNGRKTPIKMAGYLEKKSKMRVVCRWKKLWFVLEGRLLLYYKSQLEYLSLSPCRGTVNMGLAASVIPGKSNEIIVSTRSHTVSLRALNRSDHDIWLQALMDAMCMPNSNHALCCAKPVHHFRYSTGGLDHLENKVEVGYKLSDHANTLSGQLSPLYVKTSQNVASPSVILKTKSISGKENIIERDPADSHRRNTLQNSLTRGIVHDGKDYKVEKLAKKFSKIAVSDTSIPGKFKVTSNDNIKGNMLRRSLSVEEEVNRYSENIYESLKDVNKFESNVISKQARKFVNRVNRSDSDCLMMISREKMNKSHTHFRSEQRIKTSGCSPLPIYERFGETFYGKKTNKPNNGDAVEKLWNLKMKYNSNSRQNFEKEAKSDTDLSIRKHHSPMDDSRNYGTLYKTIGLSKRNSESYDFSNLQEIIKEKTRGSIPLPGAIRSSRTSRSNSILRTLTRLKSSEKSSSDLIKRNSMKKRSLSFLKKIWKRKEPKWEVDSFSSELNNFQEMQGPSSDCDNLSDFSTNDLSTSYDLPQPEPPPDYDQVNGSDDEICQQPPQLPPRFHHTRSASPCHDVPSNNKPVDPEPPPALPIKVRKLRKKNKNTLDFLFHENSDPGLRYLFQDEEYVQENGKENNNELGEMLTKLNEINTAPLASFHLYENGQNSFGVKENEGEEDPDYDIPRPHVSLLSNLRKQSCVSDSIPATHFFSQFEDSLDVITPRHRFEEFTMAPDSLECDPWSLSNEPEAQIESWSLSCDLHERKSMSDNLHHESLYQDSLNPPINHRLNEYMHLQAGYIKLHS
uniref:PH domain-containing protein n=4 Tax=Rhodnius prolixus TaxID=13249 RepID=T1HQH5_RHOPR